VFPPIETASPDCRKEDKQQQPAAQPTPPADLHKGNRYRQLLDGDGGGGSLVRGPRFRAFVVVSRRMIVDVW
jgi:hypothetical protein